MEGFKEDQLIIYCVVQNVHRQCNTITNNRGKHWCTDMQLKDRKVKEQDQ